MQNQTSILESGANGQSLGLTPYTMSKANGILSTVSREFRSFVTDIEDLLKSTTSLSGADLAQAKAKLSARVTAAKQSAEKAGGMIAIQTRQTARLADSYVHQQPWLAIGLGSVLGLMAGFALSRRV